MFAASGIAISLSWTLRALLPGAEATSLAPHQAPRRLIGSGWNWVGLGASKLGPHPACAASKCQRPKAKSTICDDELAERTTRGR